MDTRCPRSVPSLASEGDEPAQRSCALLASLETHIKTRVYPTFTKHPYNTIHLPSCIELMSRSMTTYPLTYGALGIRFALPLSHGGRESSFYPLTHGRTSIQFPTCRSREDESALPGTQEDDVGRGTFRPAIVPVSPGHRGTG